MTTSGRIQPPALRLLTSGLDPDSQLNLPPSITVTVKGKQGRQYMVPWIHWGKGVEL